MVSRDVIQQLKRLRYGGVDPRPEWVASERIRLVAQISNTVSRGRAPAERWEGVWATLSLFLPSNVVYNVIRPLAVLIIVLLVGTSSYIATVDAAYEAYPGDLMYPVSRAVQKTQVAMASLFGGTGAATKLQVKIAHRLADKTKKISSSNDPQKTAHLSVAVADLKSELAAVGNKLEQAAEPGKGTLGAAEMKDVKQNTEQIKDALQDVKNNLLVSASTADKLVSEKVSEAKDLVKDVGVRAVEAMVAKHLEGDTSVSKDEVKQVIDSALQTAATEAVTSKQNVDEVKTIVDSANTEAKHLSAAAAKVGGEAATTTRELSEKISSVANQTVRAVLKTEVAAAEVDKKVTEARAFLGHDNLAEAVGKVREANDATKEAEKISDSTIAKAQTVLPGVPVIKEAGSGSTAASSSLDGVSDGLNFIPVLATSSASKVISTTPEFKVPIKSGR